MDHSLVNQLYQAIKNGNLEQLKFVTMRAKLEGVEPKQFVNKMIKTGVPTLLQAANYSRLDIATYLIEQRADVNGMDSTFRTPLHSACKSGDAEFVKLLVGHNANVNILDSSQWTPLHYAVFNDRVDIVKILLSSGPVHETSLSPLQLAINSGYVEITSLLIKKGLELPDLDANTIQFSTTARDSFGNTFLHVIISNGADKLFDYLMKSKARDSLLNQVNYAGQTPLHVALQLRRLKYMKDLIEVYKCDTDVKDADGHTPLAYAKIIRLESEVLASLANRNRSAFHIPDVHPIAPAINNCGGFTLEGESDQPLRTYPSNSADREAEVTQVGAEVPLDLIWQQNDEIQQERIYLGGHEYGRDKQTEKIKYDANGKTSIQHLPNAGLHPKEMMLSSQYEAPHDATNQQLRDTIKVLERRMKELIEQTNRQEYENHQFSERLKRQEELIVTLQNCLNDTRAAVLELINDDNSPL